MTNDLSNLTAIAATCGLAICLIQDLRAGLYRIVMGRNTVLIAVFIWFLLEPLRLPDDLKKYDQSEYDYGIFCVVISVVVFLAAYHSSRLPLFAMFARRLPMVGQPRVLWLLVLGGMSIGIGSLLIYSGFDFAELFRGLIGPRPRWSGLGRGRYGSWSSIIFELQMFLQATVPLAVALVFMTKAPLFQRVIAGTFVLWMFLRVFWSGSRTPMIPIFLSIAAAVFFSATPAIRKRLILAGIPVALVAGILWSTIVVAGRNSGRFEMADLQKTNYVGYEMFRELLYIVRATEAELPLQFGMTYFTQLVNPIPRAIWPGKPVADAGLLLAVAMKAVDKSGEATLTNSPGFIGEAYLNFGVLGMLIVPMISGVVVRAWDGLFPLAAKSLPVFIIYAGGLAAIFMSGRSFNLSTFYGLLSLFVLMLGLEMLGFGSVPSNSTPVRQIQLRRRPLMPSAVR